MRKGGKDLKTAKKKLAALALAGMLAAVLGNGISVSAENQGTEMVKHFCNTTTEQISLLPIPFFKWCHISI